MQLFQRANGVPSSTVQGLGNAAVVEKTDTLLPPQEALTSVDKYCCYFNYNK